MRWLPSIFNRTASIYQTATRWALRPYWITTWVIVDEILICVCFLDDLILGFLLQQFEIGNRWMWTCITHVLQAYRQTKCASRPYINIIRSGTSCCYFWAYWIEHSVHYLKFCQQVFNLSTCSYHTEYIDHLICSVNFGFVSDAGERIRTSMKILVVEFPGRFKKSTKNDQDLTIKYLGYAFE